MSTCAAPASTEGPKVKVLPVITELPSESAGKGTMLPCPEAEPSPMKSEPDMPEKDAPAEETYLRFSTPLTSKL